MENYCRKPSGICIIKSKKLFQAHSIWHHISLAMWEEWGILYLWYLGLKLIPRFMGIFTILILVLILVLICVLNIVYWYIGTYLYYSWWMCYLGMLHGQSNWSLSRQGQLLSEVWFHCIKNAQSAYGHIQSALTIELITRHGYLLIICGLRPQSKVAQDENIQITIAELFDILPPCVISAFIVIISFIITHTAPEQELNISKKMIR